MEDRVQRKDEVILIAPNGEERSERYKPEVKVGKLLKEAVHDFGKDGHLDPKLGYVLTKGGAPLDETQSLKEAGVKSGDRLNIRSKAVPADGDAPGN